MRKYIKYSSVPLQAAAIVLIFVLGGRELDKMATYKFPFFTLLGIVLGVFAAFYIMFREFIKPPTKDIE